MSFDGSYSLRENYCQLMPSCGAIPVPLRFMLWLFAELAAVRVPAAEPTDVPGVKMRTSGREAPPFNVVGRVGPERTANGPVSVRELIVIGSWPGLERVTVSEVVVGDPAIVS